MIQVAASFGLPLLFFAGLLGCATSPKIQQTVVGPAGHAEGQWRGKALVRQPKTSQTGLLDLEIIAREPAEMRLEITGSFSVHVASVAMSGGGATYILTREKKFISAPANAESMGRVIPLRIPPAALMSILFDRELPSADWQCENDRATRLPLRCKHRTSALGVEWLERSGRSRRLKVTSRDAQVELVLDEAKSKVEFSSDSFKLAPPEGYKQERIDS